MVDTGSTGTGIGSTGSTGSDVKSAGGTGEVTGKTADRLGAGPVAGPGSESRAESRAEGRGAESRAGSGAASTVDTVAESKRPSIAETGVAADVDADPRIVLIGKLDRLHVEVKKSGLLNKADTRDVVLELCDVLKQVVRLL